MTNVNNETAATVEAKAVLDAFLAQGSALDAAINGADAEGTKQRVLMTAALVAFGRKALQDADVLDAAERLAKSRDISIPDMKRHGNIFKMFLMLVRAKEKDGKWELPTRGDERYARIARLLWYVGVADEDVVPVLTEHREIGDGNDGTMKATVANIEKADQALFGEQREPRGLDKKVRERTKALVVVGELALPKWAVEAFEASDGFGLAVYEMRGNKLRILGDSGRKNREVFGVIEKRIEQFEKAAPNKPGTTLVLKEVLASLTPKKRTVEA